MPDISPLIIDFCRNQLKVKNIPIDKWPWYILTWKERWTRLLRTSIILRKLIPTRCFLEWL